MTDPTLNKTWNKANPARYASSVWFKLVSTPSSQRSREFGNSLALDGSLDRTHNGHQWPNQTHASRQSKSKSTHVEARFQCKSFFFPNVRTHFYISTSFRTISTKTGISSTAGCSRSSLPAPGSCDISIALPEPAEVTF